MNPTEKTPFWVVWNPNGHIPMHKHTDEESAMREAKRLAKERPDDTFYVLKPIAGVKVNDYQITRFDDDEIPF